MEANKQINEEQKLTDVVENKIIRLITANSMKPGDKLPNEYQLAQELGVGRNTLREAMTRLAARNVLEIRQGSGTFVSEKRGVPTDPLGLSFTKNDTQVALDLFDVRLMLEPQVAALAAKNVKPKTIQKLTQICESVEKHIEAGESYYIGDEAFHTCIAECSGNTVLKTLIPILVSSIYMTTSSTGDKFRENTYREHRKILNAIKRADTIGASTAMTAHLNTSREYLAAKSGKGKITSKEDTD